MSFWKQLFQGKNPQGADGIRVNADPPPPISLRDLMAGNDFCRDVPEGAITQIVCFVGSPALQLSEADAARAYAATNPAWSRSHPIRVLAASSELDTKQACSLKCIEAIVGDMAHRETVIQARSVQVTNLGRGVQLCFATLFGQCGRTDVFMLEEEIPFG